jgi:hypothetical protein
MASLVRTISPSCHLRHMNKKTERHLSQTTQVDVALALIRRILQNYHHHLGQYTARLLVKLV